MESATKLIISHLIGKRDGACANEFVRDLSDGILGRCPATSDGFKPYSEAVAEAWGPDMDIAQLTNVYLQGLRFLLRAVVVNWFGYLYSGLGVVFGMASYLLQPVPTRRAKPRTGG